MHSIWHDMNRRNQTHAAELFSLGRSRRVQGVSGLEISALVEVPRHSLFPFAVLQRPWLQHAMGAGDSTNLPFHSESGTLMIAREPDPVVVDEIRPLPVGSKVAQTASENFYFGIFQVRPS